MHLFSKCRLQAQIFKNTGFLPATAKLAVK